jgi:glucose uptake protein GlcU
MVLLQEGTVVGNIWAAVDGNKEKFWQDGGGASAVIIGTLLAILSAVANGSFSVFSKTNSVQRANVDPLVFNFWACLGVVISSLLVLVKEKFVFEIFGLLSGLFLVLSLVNAFRVVRLIGVSVGFAIWAGVAVVVSFLAGELVEPQGVSNRLLATIAIAIIIVGIVALAWSGHLGRLNSGQEERLESLLQSEQGESEPMKNFMSGIFIAIITGIFGGLILIPETLAHEGAKGIAFLPSFGIGVAIFTPIITAIPFVTGPQWPNFAVQATILPGIASGVVWNIGNVLSLLAINYLGYSIAYPIFQCGIFIAGIWGMLLFNEIIGNAVFAYWGSGIVILAGIIVLSIAR